MKIKRCPKCKRTLLLVRDEYGTMYICPNEQCNHAEPSK